MQGVPVTNQEKLKIIELFEAKEDISAIVNKVGFCSTTARNVIEDYINGRIDKRGYKTGRIVKVERGRIKILINPIEYIA